jgi:hypothetical protein
MTETKKRGRKSIKDGGVSAPKNIFCVCSSVIDGKLVSDKIHCISSNKNSTNEEVFEEAVKLFVEAHGSAPEAVSGPYYDRVRIKAKTSRSIVSDLDIDTANFVPNKLGQAVYNGWNVSVRLVEQNPNAAFILYKSHIDDNKKKNKPKDKFVVKDALQDLVFE